MDLAENCVRHARMFFNRPDLDLGVCHSRQLCIDPHDWLLSDLRRDDEAMSGMVVGQVPNVDVVFAARRTGGQLCHHPTSQSSTRDAWV